MRFIGKENGSFLLEEAFIGGKKSFWISGSRAKTTFKNMLDECCQETGLNEDMLDKNHISRIPSCA